MEWLKKNYAMIFFGDNNVLFRNTLLIIRWAFYHHIQNSVKQFLRPFDAVILF
jgi:hypothetical protein